MSFHLLRPAIDVERRQGFVGKIEVEFGDESRSHEKLDISFGTDVSRLGFHGLSIFTKFSLDVIFR